jgi:site-specific recombinase XerD
MTGKELLEIIIVKIENLGIELKYEVHPHSLRHSFASYLIYKGIDLLTVSKLLGHENLNVTLKVYAHQLKEMEQENNDVVRKIFNKL